MDAITPRKHMAGMGGATEGTMGNFGVDGFHEPKVNGGTGNMMEKVTHKTNDDASRAGPPHVKRGGGMMPATAHSDHGPHQLPPEKGAFGVGSMKSMNG
jgi:hypothetical protein